MTSRGGQNPRAEAEESPAGYLRGAGGKAILASIVDVHTAKAGAINCLETLQRGPDGHICEVILTDIPYCCHGKAKSHISESRVPTQSACQGEGTIL